LRLPGGAAQRAFGSDPARSDGLIQERAQVAPGLAVERFHRGTDRRLAFGGAAAGFLAAGLEGPVRMATPYNQGPSAAGRRNEPPCGPAR